MKLWNFRIPMALALLLLLIAVVGAEEGTKNQVYHKLPGTADYELISAYEDLVTMVTNNMPLGLQDLPRRMILFSAWYIASRSLHSAFAGGVCSCRGQGPASLQGFIRTRICKLDPDAMETISPFLFGENEPSQELTPAELWAHVAKRSLYLAEIGRTYAGVTADAAFQASLLSLAHLAASLPEQLGVRFLFCRACACLGLKAGWARAG